jgi:hypothetical protein
MFAYLAALASLLLSLKTNATEAYTAISQLVDLAENGPSPP